MDATSPFRPQGPANVIAVTPAGGTATKPVGPNAGDVAYLCINPAGSPDVWLGYGMTSAAAVANGVVPLLGGSSNAVPMPGGSIQVFTFAPGLFFSPITQLGSASISITPGFGE